MTDALCGFFGKVPTHGDFISRRLPRSFLEPWDRWLQGAIAASRQQLGEGWLEVYLVSPLWRFCLSPGLCGPELWAGIVMPSVDRVGRYFPLCIAVSLPAGEGLFGISVQARAWFDDAQAVILSALEDEAFDVAEFDERVRKLAGGSPVPEPGPVLSGVADGDKPWRMPLRPDSPEQLSGACTHILHSLAKAKFGAYSLWWTEGSEQVMPSLLTCAGLPPPEGFAALLNGRWQDAGVWQDWAVVSSPSGSTDNAGDPASSP